MINKHNCWKKEHPNNYKHNTCSTLTTIDETCVEKIRYMLVNVASWSKRKRYIIKKGKHKGDEIPNNDDGNNKEDKCSSFPDKLFMSILQNMSNIKSDTDSKPIRKLYIIFNTE